MKTIFSIGTKWQSRRYCALASAFGKQCKKRIYALIPNGIAFAFMQCKRTVIAGALRNISRENKFHYRSQTSFVKVMFSQVSVCSQGGGLCPQGRGLCPGGLCHGKTCGQYTSYWNVFLFWISLLLKI